MPNDVFVASRVVDDAVEKCFCLKISIVWPMVRRVRHASGIVGRPIRLETAGLWSTYACPGVRLLDKRYWGRDLFSFFDEIETENVGEPAVDTWPDMIEFRNERMFTPVD